MNKFKAIFRLFSVHPCFIFIVNLALLLLPECINAQKNKGLPFITNYRYQDYNAGGVNWWAAEDDKGVMYFANDRGILVYDGQQWETITPPGIAETRSLVKGKDGKIYVGTTGDIGYIGQGKKGKLEFVSLKNKIPEKDRKFNEVWETQEFNGDIFFRATNKLYRWDNKTMKVYESKEGFHVGDVVNGQYYVRIWGRGLTVLKNDSFHVVPNGEKFANERIYAFLPYDKDRMLIGTRTQGLFIYDGKDFIPFKTEADAYLVNKSLYGGILLSNGNFAFNNFNDGIVIIDKEGKLVQVIDKTVGLMDNAADYVFEDSRGILWIPLFNGIAKFDLNSSLTYYNETMGLPGKAVFSVGIINDTIYAGTNTGVYMLNKLSNRFEKLAGSSGQIGNFILNGNDLLVAAADNGLQKIKAGKIVPVITSVNYNFNINGFQRSKIDTTLFYCSLRSGMAIVKYNPNNGTYSIQSFNPDISFGGSIVIETEEGNLWIPGENPGEVRLLKFNENGLNHSLEKVPVVVYNSTHGLPTRPVNLLEYDGKAYYFSEKDSIFVFDKNQNKFIQDKDVLWSKSFVNNASSTNLHTPDHLGRIWANAGSGVFVKLPTPDGSVKIIDAPFRELRKNYPVWSITPTIDKDGKEVVWFSSNEGIIRYDGNLAETKSDSIRTIIRSITLNEDSVFYSGLELSADKPDFSHKWNSVRFQFAAPFFKQENETLFSTYLDGWDKGWSEWSKQNFREFGNLSGGTYTFRVKSKNIYDIESAEVSYTFSVSPPWYGSWWAYILYAIIAAVIIYLIVRWRTQHLHEKHRELEKTVAERTYQLSHRVEELAVINSVQEGLVSELNMQGIYELVGEKIREIFEAQVIDIATYDSQANLLEDRYAYEKGDRTLVGKWEPKGFRKHVIDTGQLLLINKDLDNKSEEYGSSVIHGELPKSVVFVPMISQGKVMGMISLQNLDKENAFSDSSVSLLTTLANSMSVALESAKRFDETNRLLKETEQRNAELAVINSVQDGLVREMDMQGIYELVGEKIREIFDAQVIDIVTYDKKTNLIEDRYAYEKGDRSLLPAREAKGFRKHIINSGELLLINENTAQAIKDYDNPILIGEMPKSQVYVPMKASGEVTGIISLQNLDHEHAFLEPDVRLLNTLANTMSIALESARNYDETKRLLKETEQRNAELAVINSVQDGLVREMDMEGIYELVGEKIREIFDAQVIDIVMYDRKTKMIEDRYSYEKGDRTLLGPRKPFGFRKHVIENKVEMMINKDLEKLSVEYNSPVIQGETPKSMIMVPMIAGSNITGIISLQNIDHEEAFSDSDLRLINTLANTMSIALESARLFDETKRLLKETKQRNAELAVINSVQDGLVREMDMQGIYELVGEKIREIFDAQVIDIVTYDSRTNLIEDRYSYEKGDRSLLGPRAPKGFRKHIIETGVLLLHNDNVEKAMREFDNEVLIGEMPKSQVYVPMITGGEVNGIISLQNIDHEHAFSESDIRLINTLANTMSIALGSARLFDETKRLLKETEQRTAELSVINSVQEGLVREMDITGIYTLVGEKMRDIFNAQVFDIVTYDKSTDLIEDRYTFEKGDQTLLGPRPLKGFRKHVIETARPLIINNNLDEQRLIYDQKVLTGVGAKSLVMVPMIAAGEATGVISLQNLDQENAFSDSDVRLLGTFASSMSVALENARLFDETTRLLKETEQRTAELAVINSVQDGLAKELDIKGIYTLVGERIRELFDAQVVAIATFNHEDQTEKFEYIVEKGERFYPEARPIGKLRLHLIKTRQKIIINKQEESYAWFGTEVVPGTEPLKSGVFVPLIIGDKITSYVTLQNVDRENAFNESDVRLLETLANSMSVALENARLFDETTRLLKETEQRTAELAVINSVQDGLATELDIQGIYNLVGDRIRDLFDAQVVAIATFNHEDATEKFQYIVEKGERFYPEARPFDKLRTHLIASRQKILINSDFIEAYNKFGMKAVSGTALPKSALFVPLSIGEKITSYVTLQNIDRENAFSDSDVRLLETLANSMSVALENARLFDETTRLLKETEQRTAELAVINSVQEGLAKELDMQAIYDLIGDRIIKVFNAPNLVIRTFDHDTGKENWRYAIEKGERQYIEPKQFVWHSKQLIQTQKPIHINEDYLETSKKFGGTGVFVGQPTKSGIFVPMIVGGIVKGSVSLQNVDKEFAYNDADLRLLTTITNSMSVALENARLFDETTRLLKETEQRTAELAVINSVQEGLAKELDMQGIYNMVGDRLCSLFPDTQILVIRTFEHDTGLEHWQYVIEKGTRFYNDPSPFTWANKQLIQTKKYLHINENYVETAKKYGGTGVAKGQPPKSAIFVPMIVGDLVKGSVSLQNVDKENAFNDSDIRLLTTLTNSMSVALENARLFDETNRLLKETEQRTAELAVINSVQEGLVREMDMQGIYNLVGDRVQTLFNAQVVIIATFDLENKTEHFNYFFENNEKFKADPRPINKFRQLLIDKKHTIHIATEEEAIKDYGLSPIGDSKMTKSLLYVPLLTGSIIRGYVSLQNIDIEHAFSDSDIRLLETLANSMSVALENARLFDETNRLLKETEQRTAELAVINSVQDGLAKELDIQGIYDLVGDRLCDLFPDTQTLVIRTFDHDTGNEHFQYAIEKGERLEVEARPFMWANQQLIRMKKAIDIKENYVKTAQKFGGSGVTKGKPPKSAVFVPMIVGDVVRGSISLQNVDRENAFNESDLRLLTTITNSMSVALENARLFDETHRLLKETEQRTAELAVINSVQDGLVREMNMQAIYDLVGDRICNLFDTQTVLIRTFDHRTGQETWQYVIEKGQRLYSNPRPFIWANKRLIETKESLLINENYLETAQKYGGSGVTKGLPPKSALFVPMIVGDVVKGSVSLQNVEKENAFTESDLRLLTTLTNSMSVALENARLFDESNRLLSEAKQRASELATVNNITQALASQINLEELIELVGDEIRQLFRANITYLALLDKETNMINFPYRHGDIMEPMKMGDGLSSKIILTGEPLLINKDILTREAQMGIKTVGIPAASYLGVPISVGDEVIGVLSVQSTEQENRFNEDDLRLLNTIATSVGVALRKAKLFEEIHLAKQDAENAKKTAERANEAKSAFLSTVSHELRTPLTSVLGFAKIIKKRLDEKIFPITDKTDPKTAKTIKQIADNLDVVVSEGQRLTHLINDVLDLAKIEAGKMEWNSEPVSIPEITERAIAATTALFESNNLKLVKEIKTDIPDITGDKDKLIQVMVNLISNAVKFSLKGKVTIKVQQEKDEIIASITDTGIGIAPEDHAAVFEQFKQVGDTLTDKPKGTGLGLPICKEIVEHHGGRIWLDSELGKGSTFYVAIPIQKSTSDTASRPIHLEDLVKQLKEQVAHSQLNIIGKAAHILVVDDDDSIRSLLHQELGEAGYEIVEASNGKEALECVRKRRPDLIILDIMMPEMNGFDVAAVLKNDPNTMDIPIIVLSIVQDKTRGFRIGVDRYLTKPIDTGLLFNEIGSLLEQGKSKKKVMIVDEDGTTVNTLTDVLKAKGYTVMESNGKELMEKAIANQPDIIIMNSVHTDKQDVVKSLRFEKGMENVLFLVYQ